MRAAVNQVAPVPRAVVACVLLVLIGLLALPVVDALISRDESAPLVVAVSVAEVLIGLVGAMMLHRRGELVSRPAIQVRWRSALWLVALCVGWGALIVLTKQAAYLGFVLYFLALWLLPPAIGTASALVLAILTGLGQSVHHGTTSGAFIGPIAAAVVLAAMMIGTRALIAESTARAALIDVLESTQARLADSEREAGRLAERTRIGRELHDTVAQHLSSIQLLIHAAEREPGNDAQVAHLRAAREAASSALTDTRAFIRDLTPEPLAGRSLSTAIERVAAAANSRGLIQVRTTVDGTPRNLPTATEATLLRIAQEAIANVEKHAGPAHVDVRLEYADSEVSLEVNDDGVGFDSESVLEEIAAGRTSSYGLMGMRERAAELGGYVVVMGDPGDGTLVSVQIPTAPGEAT